MLPQAFRRTTCGHTKFGFAEFERGDEARAQAERSGAQRMTREFPSKEQ